GDETLTLGLSVVSGGAILGAPNSATLTIHDDAPPTIAANGQSRSAGGVTSNSIIANVNDAEDAKNTLVVTVNNGSSALVGGVSVSNLSVNAAGEVTADVSATCAAST